MINCKEDRYQKCYFFHPSNCSAFDTLFLIFYIYFIILNLLLNFIFLLISTLYFKTYVLPISILKYSTNSLFSLFHPFSYTPLPLFSSPFYLNSICILLIFGLDFLNYSIIYFSYSLANSHNM